MTDKTELPELTAAQKSVLERFGSLDAGLDEVRLALRGIFEFDLDNASRTAHSSFKIPIPGLLISREHIENALSRKRAHRISEGDLVSWATFLLINPAYDFDPADEDLITGWLNDISYNLEPY